MMEKPMQTPEQKDTVSHSQHRKRMRARYLAEGLSSMEPHQVLEMLLFDVHPRRDTNPIAHRLLEEYGSLTNVLKGNHPVDGAGEGTLAFLRETDRELQEIFCEALDKEPVLEREQLIIAAEWMRRRFPKHTVIVLCDESGHFREMQPMQTQDLMKIAEALLPVMPEEWVCHLAYFGNDREDWQETEREIRNLRRYFERHYRKLGWVLRTDTQQEFRWVE